VLRTALGVCVAGVLLSSTTIAAGAPPTHQTVVVRVYNSFGAAATELRTAEHTVKRLLNTVDVESTWRNCRIVGRPSIEALDPCGTPVSDNEVIIRIVRALDASDPSAALGESVIDPLRNTGTLGTVYADRINLLARVLYVDQGTLLGRAVAHEIAHLLLGTKQHAAFGLMRGRWSHDAVIADRDEDWSFSAQQGEDIRAGLARRAFGRARFDRAADSK
jgi:hypothetical protein